MSLSSESFEPAYRKLYFSGELQHRAEQALAALGCCRICPRQCQVNRLAGEVGFCQVGRRARVASYGPHFGEEGPLVGGGGSGTIFFAGCNLSCVFCQNAGISQQLGEAPPVEPVQLAAIMLELQAAGVENINLVTPSHVVPQILAALIPAVAGGLRLPLVYNSGGYDSVATLRWLDGVVDIYLPDCKFSTATSAERYCAAADYPDRARAAVREMHRQVGDLVVDRGRQNLARRGLLVRHLVMPEAVAGTEEWLRFLAREISPNTYLNLMDQYRPCHRVAEFPELNRPLRAEEFARAKAAAGRAGLRRLDHRDHDLAARLWRSLLAAERGKS
jgi:putative pyruvate formate lyase activating enzyme